MFIREAIFDDVLIMKELHDRAIMELCRNDYTIQQLVGWINKSPIEKYYWRLETQRIFIAEQTERLFGFVRWYPKTNELCSICVEPEFARQGIGSRLMKRAYEDAKDHNVDTLWLDSSLTAAPFYKTLGWVYVALITDGPLDCIRMEKDLSTDYSQEENNLGVEIP